MAVFGFDMVVYGKSGEKESLGLQAMSVAFERAGLEATRFGEYAFPKLIPIMEKELGAQFKAEGRGPNRGKWAPLSPAYARWKQKHFPGKPILERTGTLRDALTRESSPFALRAYSATAMSFGTTGVQYASFHQTGTERGLPDRPMFDFTPEFEDEVKAAALAGARDLVKASRLDHYATFNAAGENARLNRDLDSALAGDD